MSIKLPKIFLDSGDPAETRKAKGILGFLDGQTTNPSLVSKHPDAASYLEKGKKLTEKELLNFYKQIVIEIRKEIAGSISVEVYADWKTRAEAMLKQAEEMNSWTRNLHIKFPAIPEGLKAANEFSKKNRVNMTLVFDQHQAAASYAATDTGGSGINFVSPFIGRWDDRGYDGLDLVKNIIKMYKKFDRIRKKKQPHIEVLSASIRSLDHLYGCIFLGTDIVTVPLKIIYEWVENQIWIPDTSYRIDSHGLKALPYEDLQLKQSFSEYKLAKEKGSLIDEGLMKFSLDWKKLLQ